MNLAWRVLLALVLVAPGAMAQASQPELNDLLWGPSAVGISSVYLVDGFTTTTVGTHSHDVFSARYDTRDRVSNGTWVIIITAAYSITMNSNGAWQWQVSLDGEELPGCLWQVQTINSEAGLTGATTIAHPNLQLVCRVQEPPFGTHTITITRSAVTGNPATVARAVTSVNILNNDPVILSMPTSFEAMTGLTALEFLVFPALAFLGVFLWTRQDQGIRLFGVFLVAFTLALVFSFYAASGGSWPGMLVLVFSLLLLLAWMSIGVAKDAAKARRLGP